MRVIVIGAGVAGLTSAQRLTAAGHTVTVLDKGRRPGGRLATKLMTGGARADHGAQFFTVRSDELAEALRPWLATGAAHEWCRGFSAADGHPRYSAPGGMASLAGVLAEGLDVRSSTRVGGVTRTGSGWRVAWDAAHGHPAGALEADFVILTPPPAQSAELLAGVADVPTLAFEPIIALLLALDRPPRIPAPGGAQLRDDVTWSWVADNVAKGTSERPAVTLHTTPAIATTQWDRDRDELLSELTAAAGPWLGSARVIDRALHRWRYAAALDLHPDPCLTTGDGRLILAGDAFASPRFEGAFLSGLAAAARVLES